VPKNTKRIVLNFHQADYNQTRQGLRLIEIQLKRTSHRDNWLVVFFANFSYPDDNCHFVEQELYFHLMNLWWRKKRSKCPTFTGQL